MSVRALTLVLLAGCTKPMSPNYELDCEPSSTATAALMQCVRTDTRNGDVLVVDYMKVPTSNGSTATSSAPAGHFTTKCAAPGTTTRADFYCVRLNTETGELLLVNLTKVGLLPPRT